MTDQEAFKLMVVACAIPLTFIFWDTIWSGIKTILEFIAFFALLLVGLIAVIIAFGINGYSYFKRKLQQL